MEDKVQLDLGNAVDGAAVIFVLDFTLHFSNFVSSPHRGAVCPAEHTAEKEWPGRLSRRLKMSINLLGPESKSFMVRKINDNNLPLNSDKSELMSLSTDT